MYDAGFTRDGFGEDSEVGLVSWLWPKNAQAILNGRMNIFLQKVETIDA